MVDKDKNKTVKVPFRFNSKGYDQSGQEYIELVDGGSNGQIIMHRPTTMNSTAKKRKPKMIDTFQDGVKILI